MISIFIRTVLIYLLLNLSMKIMGKRQIGELEVGELITTLLVSELAAIPIDDPDIPLLNAVVPILFLVSVEVLLSGLKNQSPTLKKLVDGEPCYLVYDGQLIPGALEKNRLSLDEFLAELRLCGVGDPSEASYCILEANGKLSVLKTQDAYARALILDGAIQQQNLSAMGLENRALSKLCDGHSPEEIFLLSLAEGGKPYMILKGASGAEKSGGRTPPSKE